jgi:acetyl-CoA carboxylase alpha subunit
MKKKFGIPVVTLIDPGAYPGLEAEERGQGGIARNIF